MTDPSCSLSPAPPSEWLMPVLLVGRQVTLVPLTPEHAADLHAGADETTSALLARGGPEEWSVAGWANYITALNALPHRVNWAVLMGGRAVGRISYSEVQVRDRWVEIGTMLVPAAQGTAANPESKLLLMTRAFETLGANRVQFKVDARNARSLRALQKLGAVQEGTLRQYQVRPDGYARDSVIFSVLRDEWPRVKAGLQARLAALA
ncbi:GCN5-related N-acetyltransferase [Deinococcus geothermalis DSM 11300]|uniref:GCN5-related N-acetyltransferase n=1 Tax=Deinococcus geothermalis (strain DSM 11300 / CIP 105573 / AG-3a) TaxID=319795 RepID=Q1IY75_DEIGD|nr:MULTISPECIES: GNAT family protein [Deinococcus]ABF45809.1 GCN5-related N-acetyltransferase [Deinococcus geothermalis DSM 11300]